MVTFKPINLMEDFRTVGRFDIVFCRNVLIYFERDRKREILARIAAQMRDGATLFLGAAETTLGVCNAFESSGVAHGSHVKRAVSADAAIPQAAAR
jgi:chemotaxis protein methyltransferase CheR